MLALLLAACGRGGSSGGAGGTSAAVCAPGSTQVCVGPGACSGAQSCLADGSGWSTCDCGGTAGTTGGEGSSGPAGRGGAGAGSGGRGGTGRGGTGGMAGRAAGGTTGAAGATGAGGMAGFTVLVSDAIFIRDFEIDGQDLYYLTVNQIASDNVPSAIKRVPVGGGTAATLTTTAREEILDMAVGSTQVVFIKWGLSSNGAVEERHLMAVNRTGGGLVMLQRTPSSLSSLPGGHDRVGIYRTSAYWLAEEMNLPGYDGLYKVDTSGSAAPRQLGSPKPWPGFVVREKQPGYAEIIGGGQSSTLGDEWHVSIWDESTQLGISLSRNSGVVLETMLAADAAYVYWSDGFNMIRSPRDQTRQQLGTIPSDLQFWSLQVDDQYLYFVRAGTIVRMPKSGGPLTTLYTDSARLGWLRVDDTYLYFTRHSDTGSQIVRRPKAAVGGGTGAGGAGGTGAGGSGGSGAPACPSSITDKSTTCSMTGQVCPKTCGIESMGTKNCTCSGGVFVCDTAVLSCRYPPGADLSCYSLTPPPAACPSDTQHNGPCLLPACVPCSGYMDSSGNAKVGYCVCVNDVWKCASDKEWPLQQ